MTHALFRNSAAHSDGFRDVDPQTLAAHRGEARLVDVREPHEWTGELGHIAGAQLVPLATVTTVARAWHHDDEIVLVCRSGGRSAQAARQLVARGFKRVINQRGGMIAHTAVGLPIERTSS